MVSEFKLNKIIIPQKKGSKDKALHAKNRANLHHDAEITEAEPSRTPEDSVCSVEGPTEMVLTSK